MEIILGSKSDFPLLKDAVRLLKDMNVDFAVSVLSAHRTPEELKKRVLGAEDAEVFVCVAGLAAHLPGVVAAFTTKPVIGVPVNVSLNGLDALLSMVQMPKGYPVGTVGINNVLNGVLFALSIMAIKDERLSRKLAEYRSKIKSAVLETDSEVEKLLSELLD